MQSESVKMNAKQQSQVSAMQRNCSQMESRKNYGLRSMQKSSAATQNNDVKSQITTEIIRNYELNRITALGKKLKNANRDHIQCEMKSGNLLIEFSAASYELIKENFRYIKSEDPEMRFVSQMRKELNGYEVEQVHTVTHKNDKVCVINMWNTK